MRIRRYIGKDAQEAMLKVKMDLGSEAIILSTRKVRKKGFAGLFSKHLTEVLAAIDEDYGKKKEPNEPLKRKRAETVPYHHQGTAQNLTEEDKRVDSLENRVKQMESMLERIYSKAGHHQGEFQHNSRGDNQEYVGKEIKAESNQKDQSIQAQQLLHAAARAQEMEKKSELDSEKAFALFRSVLSENEIEPVIVDKITEKIKQFVKSPCSYDDICAVAGRILHNVLGQPQPITFRDDGKPTVILFVGPTGVGKTTTLAKIAADYTLNHQKAVGLITADTYRIAAVEQLKTYAEILNIPVSVVYTPQEIKTAVSEHQDKELILIDTAGRSHRNAAQFSELKMLVQAAEADEVYLVLSCSMGRAACREILSHYQFLQKYKILFTKLDEALVPGIILNVRYATGKPLSYTTAGQSVPDDIEIANVSEIVKSMVQVRNHVE